ncbi:hypothetical protein FHX41_2475 [Actinomadura hallensis]|uniref:Uncharacterized protein n=1 Tax=Actinomadura hallensis TaxID=337895 RepID=A0A543IDZ2_9ACTN|nr:hypothetical protein [Actinomadura hallensis]TQM68807.1 hypothetical protein FHX41_2475 [Actinomadura hallensis]HLV75272.1 hypothetical protein [Vulgatibacteraceae bacterium]
MSVLASLARLEAVAAGVARPLATVRHCHVADAPLVLVPLRLAGEAAAPLAVMAGSAPGDPELLVVPQPRNRDLRFAFAADLAKLVLKHIETSRGEVEVLPPGKEGEERIRYGDAPQLLVPNRGGVAFLRLMGRSTRFRSTEGPYAVDPAVPVLGRWLTWFAERHDHPGSSLLGAMTEMLRLHWATGQSSLEDGNLAALMGWIDPPEGMDGPAAAARAEDPVVCPPAGPATDPTFDNEVLAPAIAAYDRSGGAPHAEERLRTALAGQLEPTWDLMWRAVELLRALPEGASVPKRWERDRDAFTYYHQTFGEAYPQARRDSPVRAARRLYDLERAQDAYEAQRAFDDPLVMAEHRLAGQAFGGVVAECDPERLDETGKRPKLRPRLVVETQDPVRLDPGTTVCSAARPALKGRIVEVGGGSVLVELTGGMGRRLTPEPGVVPQVGDRVCFTSLTEGSYGVARFPDREETPWTHGGPPEDYVPTDEDAEEEWS